MAVDMFLKLVGPQGWIKGESQASGHSGEIEILSWSWGETNSQGTEQGGIIAIRDFNFTKRLDFSSPPLMKFCFTGQPLQGDATNPAGLLTVRKAGEKPVDYIKVTFTDILVSSYQGGGHGGAVPTDEFSLNFAKMHFSYYKIRADGSLSSPISAEIINGGRPGA
jgi:type VI secretion system secreted protein Hcp